MNKLIILLTPVILLLLASSASAKTTGPDTDIEITCSESTYQVSWDGILNIYCDITNNGGSTKNEKVGATFDDYFDGLLDHEAELLGVYTKQTGDKDWSSIKPNMNKNKPAAKKTKQLSQQNIQTKAGETTEIWFQMKVQVPSQGKFDILYGEGAGEYKLDPWWNTTYLYKACYNLSGQTKDFTGDTWDNSWGYPFNLTLNTQSLIGSGKMNADCSDVRMIFNDSNPQLVPKYFMRDCGQSVSELWGLWNFTLGETYEFCIYYGNPSAPSNYSDRYDIVFAHEDFDNYTLDWSEYTNYTAGGAYAVIANGYIEYRCGVSGNCGFGMLRNTTHFNITKTGLLYDAREWYSFPGSEWTPGQFMWITQATDASHPEIARGSTYVACSESGVGAHNCTQFNLKYRDYWGWGNDIEIVGFNSSQPNYPAWAQFNKSNYYSSYGIWGRYMFALDSSNLSSTGGVYPSNPRDISVRLYGDYGGQPYTTEIPMIDYWNMYAALPDADMQPWYGTFADSYHNVTLVYAQSVGGGTAHAGMGRFDFWFARPYQEGEPFATGGTEIPLNSANLIVNYTDPTPANNTVRINANSVIVNVTSNKTIDTCKLQWDGSNYTMDTNTIYCFLDKSITGSHTYKVWVEDLWGWQNDTETRTLSKIPSTALLGVRFNASDFTIASSSYVTGLNATFNTSQTENLIVMTSMNVKKQTGSAQNEIWARAIVDGAVVLEERIRTVSNILDEGSTGLSAFPFNVSAGEHYIQIDFRRTGDGSVAVSDIDVNMGKFNTYIGGVVSGSISSGNFSHTATDFTPALNFTISKAVTSPTFMSFKITVSSSGANQVTYAFQNLDNTSQISPYGGRYLADPSDVGSMAGTFITGIPAGINNYTILGKNSNAVTTTANFTGIWFNLLDDSNNDIEYFQTSNPNTNDTESINISDEWTLITSATKTVVIGDSYFMGMYATYNSPTGNQTVTHKINVTGATCETKKERYLENSNDYGLTFMYFICNGLNNQTSYDFNLWAKAEPGMWFDHYDESFSGFEVQSFDITEGNIPPIPGAITSPVNGSTERGTITIIWEEFVDQNGNFDDYNVTLLNSDGTHNQTITGSTTNLNTTFDTTTVADGDYKVQVEGCDVLSACSTSQNDFSIDNTAPTITITSPENITYITYNVYTIDLDVSADEGISVWEYELNNGGIQSFSPNTTITTSQVGANNLTVYATDLAGNGGSSEVIFTISRPTSPLQPLGAFAGLAGIIVAAGWILFIVRSFYTLKMTPQTMVGLLITLVIGAIIVAWLIIG